MVTHGGAGFADLPWAKGFGPYRGRETGELILHGRLLPVRAEDGFFLFPHGGEQLAGLGGGGCEGVDQQALENLIFVFFEDAIHDELLVREEQLLMGQDHRGHRRHGDRRATFFGDLGEELDDAFRSESRHRAPVGNVDGELLAGVGRQCRGHADRQVGVRPTVLRASDLVGDLVLVIGQLGLEHVPFFAGVFLDRGVGRRGVAQLPLQIFLVVEIGQEMARAHREPAGEAEEHQALLEGPLGGGRAADVFLDHLVILAQFLHEVASLELGGIDPVAVVVADVAGLDGAHVLVHAQEPTEIRHGGDEVVAQADGLDACRAGDAGGDVVGGVGVIEEPGVGAEALHAFGDVDDDRDGADGHEHATGPGGFIAVVAEVRGDALVHEQGGDAADAEGGEDEVGSVEGLVQIRLRDELHGHALAHHVLLAELLDHRHALGVEVLEANLRVGPDGGFLHHGSHEAGGEETSAA